LPVSSDQKDLRTLRAYADALHQRRTTRRALLKSGAAFGGALAVTGGAAEVSQAAPASPIAASTAILAQGLARGTALVTSPRLPLPGIGEAQVAPLLQGDLTNWSQVGSPIPVVVSLVAVEGYLPEGASPASTVADYEALVDAFDADPGAFAMLPLEMIDSRVNVLDIDGVNPLFSLATEEAPLVRVGVAGDIIFGRNGGDRQIEFDDWNLPMYQVKDFMKSFDVTVANFECFVSETIDLATVNDLDFVTRPQSLQGLVDAGLDAVTMANNHAVFSYAGYGIPGMQETMGHLNDYGITPFGVGMTLDEARAPWVTEVNGVSIAFYGVDGVTANLDYPDALGVQQMGDNPSAATANSGGTNPLQMDQCLADIEALVSQYDIVLPYFHMGEQYIWTPMQWVVDVSRQCIDAGATAVLTAHPHATMGMEIYKGKPIYYSIGNFVYDQMFAVETREGYFLEMTFIGPELKGFRIHPVDTLDFVQPRFMSGLQTASFNDRFWRSTDLMRKTRNWDRELTRPQE
jgi:poly-gamma-glutamate synthesis protein (capsule biosynthesis protein)